MTETMRAAVYHGRRDVRIEEVPVPRPREGEVLLAVRRSGICGSDATEWAAGPKQVPFTSPHPGSGHVGPMIIGHEFVGEVVSGGSGFAAGDLVAAGAGVSCGQCDRCGEGRTNLCRRYYTLGLNAPGGLAEYVAAPASMLRRVPDGISLDHAGLAQPLAVGLHAARRAGVRPGDSVVVIGAGAIGSFVLAGLRHLSDNEVTVLDFAGDKLDRATRLGAAHVVDAAGDVVAAVRDRTGGRGADVVIEASGAPGQFENALRMVTDGGRVLAVGLPKQAPTVDLFSLVLREITVESTVAHVCGEDVAPALEILAEGVLGAELLDSVIGLDDLTEHGLARLAAGGVDGKVLIDPGRRA
ncbi:zinc-dependent alcohol dehydrogenase [Amycolatopsis sp. NPDC004368]